MREKRKIVAWLLIFVLTVSLMPGNMVKAVAEGEEQNESSGELSLYICDMPEGYEILAANGESVTVETGDNPIDGSFKAFTFTSGESVTFQVKSPSSALNYGLKLNDSEMIGSKVDATHYSFTTAGLTEDTYIYFVQKQKITSDIDIIPCDENGEILDGYGETGVKELYVTPYSYVYFKLADTEKKYQLLVETGESEESGEILEDTEDASGENEVQYWDSDAGIYQLYVENSDVNITSKPLYAVITDVDGYWWGYVAVCNSSLTEDKSNGCYNYISGEVEFILEIYEENNSDNIVVSLEGEDGTPLTLEPVSSDDEDDSTFRYKADALTQNARLKVTGIYAKRPTVLEVQFDEDTFQDISVEVIDDEGNPASKDDSHNFSVYDGKSYWLKLSGDSEILSGVRGTQNDIGEIKFDESEGSYVAALDSWNTIYLGLESQSHVTYECDNGLSGGYLCDLDTNEKFTGFQTNGKHQIWINTEDSDVYDTSEAEITKILDKDGEEVPFSKQENVTVDDYGTVRTVYTVNVTGDITIYYAGVQKRTYAVYLPLPSDTDTYSISGLSVLYIGDEDDDESDGQHTYELAEGVADTENGYTKYSNIKCGSSLRFDITVPSGANPLVQKKTSDTLADNATSSLIECDTDENENGTVTYHYSFKLFSTTEILVTLNTKELEVVAEDDNVYVEYDNEEGYWSVYKIVGENERDYICYINLPKLVDAADVDKTYDFYLEFAERYNEDTDRNVPKYRIKKGKGNNLCTAYDENETSYPLSGSYEDDPDDGSYVLPAGCYKLVLDTSCITDYESYIHLESERENITIAPASEGDYEKIDAYGEAYYVPKDDNTFSFTLTAESEEDFQDMGIYWAWTDHDEDYEESNNGLSRTYTLRNIGGDANISVGDYATFSLKQVKNVTLSSQIYDGKEDEKGVVNNLLGGMQTFLDVVVKEGYDPDSVKVIQEVNGEVVDTIELYGGNAYHGRDRWCDIKLLPGANVFYATAPKKATYKINLPEGTAYTIELVNGSKTTVDYGGSFSFKIKGKEGYDLSDMVVTADGQRMTADKNGIYTLTNIKNDYDIGVAGYKTNSFIVTFKDYNGNVIGKSQTVDFGKNATAPATPSRKGYTFAGWDRSFSNVKQNLVVTATYKQIFVNKIEISGDITKLAPEKTVTLKAAVTPENALNTGVIWTSGNTKYATVDANGKVKALKAGAGKKVTITATAKDGSGKKAVYKIAIQKKAVKKIKLSAKSKSVKPGKKVTVKATVSPSKGINKTLVWTSSNEKYATVNSKGVVTTKKAGKGKTVVITAKSTDGSGKKATIKIKIKKK